LFEQGRVVKRGSGVLGGDDRDFAAMGGKVAGVADISRRTNAAARRKKVGNDEDAMGHGSYLAPVF
jgi:hypothetical protein